MSPTQKKQSETGEGVAAASDNAKLEHSVTGATTRDDLLDAGVPMLPGSPAEPVGPEDALGVGQKRGDYRDRIPGNPHTSVALPDGGQPIYRTPDGKDAEAGDEGAVIVDYKPSAQLVAQKPRTEDIGDAEGLKGGVETDPAAALPAGARERVA